MGRPLTRRKGVNWKEKFFDVAKIADEPALNRQGFWKKPDFPHVTDKETKRN